MAGTCRPGDVLGSSTATSPRSAADLPEVAGLVVDRLLQSGGELVTLVTGEPARQPPPSWSPTGAGAP